ncbi:hypothetical protein BELL_0048g00170 [Botrytis elliptica]|uniref:PQ loop repeat protein n=1 Tax=Botrytis elliptica TaxID=278938 RepID=A0A4Z1K0J9_9HELO|nr:hypothetical protein EAE99_001978 [Botrytis elliptica]TGO78964.1 hypothetical protein BELL_0048g00170 [Botrytis elliptica]
MDIPIAANVLGTLGAICWSIQLIPQIIINYNRHHTIGLQRSMMLLWACAGVPLGAFNIASGFNVALLVQPQILTVLSLVTWGQCLYYSESWGLKKCVLVTGGLGMVFGGIEVAFVAGLKAGQRRDLEWPVILMGVMSAVLLSAGVLRHYYDIYVHRTVRGISFIFVGIDAAGDVFSLVSVFFQPHLDILGIVIYASEFILWCGVFACGGYFNLLPWIKRRIQKRSENEGGSGNGTENVVAVEEGISHDIEMERMNSVGSRTVFRTPGSINSVDRVDL